MTTSLEFGISICWDRTFSTECILVRSAVITSVGDVMRCKTPSLPRSKFDIALLRPLVPSPGLLKSVFQYAIISFDAFEPSRSRCGMGEGSAIENDAAG